MSEYVRYFTRMAGDNSGSLVLGSVDGGLNKDTVERLVDSHFEVVTDEKGRCFFVDKVGVKVDLVLAIDPALTRKGTEARNKFKDLQDEKLQRHNLRNSIRKMVINTRSISDLKLMYNVLRPLAERPGAGERVNRQTPAQDWRDARCMCKAEMYPKLASCCICGSTHMIGYEPRFGYAVCQEHADLSAVEVSDIVNRRNKPL